MSRSPTQEHITATTLGTQGQMHHRNLSIPRPNRESNRAEGWVKELGREQKVPESETCHPMGLYGGKRQSQNRGSRQAEVGRCGVEAQLHRPLQGCLSRLLPRQMETGLAPTVCLWIQLGTRCSRVDLGVIWRSSRTSPERSQETPVDSRVTVQLDQEGLVAQPTCSFKRK